MAWLPDGTFYVADGYNGTRVAKFDASGKFLLDFGMQGIPARKTRPGYMTTCTASRSTSRRARVFVNDRDNNRIQIFDETASISPSGRSRCGPRACTTS